MSDEKVEYPRHMHKAGGAFLVVLNDKQKAAALAEGWFLTPDDANAVKPKAK